MAENEQEIDVNADVTEEENDETPMERFFFHQRRALEETGKALEALLPPDFRKHGGEASREFAKGFRVLVDVTIDNLKRVSEKEDEDEEYDEEVENEEETEVKAEVDGGDGDNGNDDDEPPSTTGKTKVKVKLD
ncbi:MAG: hypothetical protein Q9P44_21760 [Anaerolineae bacterium]|nr:hypothetical protein [Anaerolineae bacterium]